VKRYSREREPYAVGGDVSGSVGVRFGQSFKREYAAEVAAR